MKQDFDVRSGDVSSMELYYSGSDLENRCIGHIRGDFGKSGDEYWATFWEHEGINVAGNGCKKELTALVNTLRKNLLKSRKAMRKYLQQHSFDPADEDGIILMPVREGMLSIPFGAGNLPFSPDGLQVEKAEIISVEDCWCIQDNCYNTDAKPGAAKIWEEAAMISLSMGNHDHEDDLCE